MLWRKLERLDSVDHLRPLGIGHQSSVKISVLEVISGVSFLVKGNSCTRYLTE